MMDGTLSRRELVRRLTGLGLTLPVAAARVAPAAAAPSPTSAVTRNAAQAAGDGTLIVGTETDIENFDPGRAIALATNRVQTAVYEGLVKYAPGTVDLIPNLATEIPTVENGGVSADGLTYT